MKKFTAKLCAWRKHIYKLDGTYVIWGFIYEDQKMRFPDGHWIHTSDITKIEGNIATTKSGGTYLLVGSPSGDEIGFTKL